MLTRTEFLFLLFLSMAGAIFAYSLADLVIWLSPIIMAWCKYSIMSVVMAVALIVIIFGVFMVWCCAKYSDSKARDIHDETNDFYEN
jgi:hypothetical protein